MSFRVRDVVYVSYATWSVRWYQRLNVFDGEGAEPGRNVTVELRYTGAG